MARLDVTTLPNHTQQQLATMTNPHSAAEGSTPAIATYQAALAARYRENIQSILKSDLDTFMAVHTSTAVAEASNNTMFFAPKPESPNRELEEITGSSDEEEPLPPYSEEEEGNSSDCTITVTELDSPDTPTDDIDQEELIRKFPTTTSIAIRPATSTNASPEEIRALPQISQETTKSSFGVRPPPRPARPALISLPSGMHPSNTSAAPAKVAQCQKLKLSNASLKAKKLAAHFGGARAYQEQVVHGIGERPIQSTGFI